ncbi:MAG: GldG family protein [Oscillospiraceae bacterium]
MKIFNSKNVKYNSVAWISTIVVIAVALIVSIIADMGVEKFKFKLDLTAEGVYQVSDKTKEIVRAIDKETTIYFLTDGSSTADSSIINFDEFLNNYLVLNNKIKLEKIDVVKNPSLVEKYLAENPNLRIYDLIIDNGENHKIVSAGGSFSQMSENTPVVMNLEQNITSALAYVSTGKQSALGLTTGHNESGAQLGLEELLSAENYKTMDVNLASGEIDPQIQTLAIVNPTLDFTEAEIVTLDKFFSEGKTAMLFMDASKSELPILNKFLKEWGIEPQNTFVVENDKNSLAQMGQNNLAMILKQGDHEIMQPIKGGNIFAPFSLARSINITKVPGVSTEVLLKTSDKAYAKKDLDVAEKTENDIAGVQNIGVISTKQMVKDNQTVEAKMIVVGSSLMLYFAQQEGANKQFLINSTNYLNQREDTVSIPAKAITPEAIQITQTQFLIVIGIILVLVPLLIFIAGIFICLRRRKL